MNKDIKTRTISISLKARIETVMVASMMRGDADGINTLINNAAEEDFKATKSALSELSESKTAGVATLANAYLAQMAKAEVKESSKGGSNVRR